MARALQAEGGMSRSTRAPRWAVIVFGLAVLWAATGEARELSGVKLPDTKTVSGESLRLNGAGVRKKAFFKVYVVGLYLEQPTRDAQVAIGSDATKHVTIVMLRHVDRGDFIKAMEKGIAKNVGAEAMPGLRQRLDRLEKAFPDLGRGTVVSFTYQPGVGTIFRSKDRQLTIKGKDFAEALLSVWLGPNPVQGNLKSDLLGK